MARRPHRFFPTSVLALGLTVSETLPAQAPKTFSGQVDIREREIVIDLPDRLKGSRLAPRDFQVLVDGEPREVTRAEPVSREGPAPWTVLVYVDRVLASPGTAFYSNLALAQHAADLTRLGAVEVVLADPDPHPELSATGDPQKLEQVLARLAGTARVERDRSRTEVPPPPSADQVGRQIERLLAFLAARHPQGPHALFLVADGTVGAPEAPFRDASQILAVSGWVGVAMAVKPDDPGKPVAPKSEIDIFQETTAWSNATNGPPPPIQSHGPRKTTLAFPRVIELSTDPLLAPLRTLASATAGTVIGYGVQLPALFEELPRRWTIWISEPGAPADGRFHSLAVRLPKKRTEARAPKWLR